MSQRGRKISSRKSVPKNQPKATLLLFPLDLASENTQAAAMREIKNPMVAITFCLPLM
jgi:hypothetical protein